MHDVSAHTPTNLIIFGITGDLSKRKLLYALFSLHKKNLLPKLFNVIGFSRREWSDKDLQEYIKKELNITDQDFLSYFHYQQGDFTQPDGYKQLTVKLDGVDRTWGVCSNKLLYLAVPPKYYEDIFIYLKASGLAESCDDEKGWSRVLVEKPFGKDYETAKKLDRMLKKLFKEEQIYRIDHYLAKEVLQNILIFRFANNLFEDSWDRGLVEKIEVTLLEKEGVDDRGSFFDGVGALRDVGQNHVLQMLALATMDDPGDLLADSVREARAEVLSDLRINLSYRGQYEGYTQTPDVEPHSYTETYFRLEGELKSSRWRGVPIVLAGGKGWSHNDKKVVITFRGNTKNKVVFDFDLSTMGIYVYVNSKKPGLSDKIEQRVFDLPICEDPMMCERVNAYERLLEDCVHGNQIAFVSSKESEAEWKIIDPIKVSWLENRVELQKYKFGGELVTGLANE